MAAKKHLIAALDRDGPRVVTVRAIEDLLFTAKDEWKVAKSTTANRLLDFLLEHCGLIRAELPSKTYPAKIRYIWGSVSPYVVAQSLKRNSYLSHGSAVFIHGLTDQIPKTIYVNAEQGQKPRSRQRLSQEGINRAFSSRQRLSKLSYHFNGYTIVILSGKHTDQLGVVSASFEKTTVLVTGLERTLIDIVVRPAYAGGIVQVLKAYRSAQGRISVKTLKTILLDLDYTYPYHQAIGFLMQRAGYPLKLLQPLRQIGLSFDFHLGYGLRDKAYDSEWRLFYPKGL